MTDERPANKWVLWSQTVNAVFLNLRTVLSYTLGCALLISLVVGAFYGHAPNPLFFPVIGFLWGLPTLLKDSL